MKEFNSTTYYGLLFPWIAWGALVKRFFLQASIAFTRRHTLYFGLLHEEPHKHACADLQSEYKGTGGPSTANCSPVLHHVLLHLSQAKPDSIMREAVSFIN